jgi:hypothetical protein
MNFVKKMSKEEIDKFTSFVDNNDASDLRNMPSLSMREEVQAFRIYLFLKTNRNYKGIVASNWSCDNYYILNFNDTIYFTEEKNDKITTYYLLNDVWQESLKKRFEDLKHLYGNINDICNIND